MKKSISIIGSILLAAALSSPAWAKHNNGNQGGESQAGGLPVLEDRVEADEALIAALQGQNNWAVVKFDGTLIRSFSSAGPVTSTRVTLGEYEVTFSKGVSGCEYQATIGDPDALLPPVGFATVSGDVDGDNNHDVTVFTFNSAGLAADEPFHLLVTCP